MTGIAGRDGDPKVLPRRGRRLRHARAVLIGDAPEAEPLLVIDENAGRVDKIEARWRHDLQRRQRIRSCGREPNDIDVGPRHVVDTLNCQGDSGSGRGLEVVMLPDGHADVMGGDAGVWPNQRDRFQGSDSRGLVAPNANRGQVDLMQDMGWVPDVGMSCAVP